MTPMTHLPVSVHCGDIPARSKPVLTPTRSVAYIAGVLGNAGRKGQEARLQAAREGKITYQGLSEIRYSLPEEYLSKDSSRQKLQKLAEEEEDEEEDIELPRSSRRRGGMQSISRRSDNEREE